MDEPNFDDETDAVLRERRAVLLLSELLAEGWEVDLAIEVAWSLHDA